MPVRCPSASLLTAAFVVATVLSSGTLVVACNDDTSAGGAPGPVGPAFDSGTAPTIDGAVACRTPTSGPTPHGTTLREVETWTAAGSPHGVPFDTHAKAPLT